VRLGARRIARALAIIVMAWPLPAAAGVLIVEKTTTGGGPAQTHQVQIDRDWMRAEHRMGADQSAFVFDGARDVVRIVNYDKKTYTELTRAEVEQLGGRMTAAMAQMQEQLKKMPAEHRAMVEAMMKGKMGGAEPVKTVYRKTGTDRVGRWTCDRYEGYQNDKKTSELCTAEPAALGLAPADFEITRKLAEFFRKLVPQNADNLFSLGKPDDQGFSGVPIKRVFGAGPRQTVTETTEITRQTFAPSTWEVPAGFAKKAYGEP
jgi:hypothetical protein